MCNKKVWNTHTYKELKLYLPVVAASKSGTRGAVTQGSTRHVPKYRIWDLKKPNTLMAQYTDIDEY